MTRGGTETADQRDGAVRLTPRTFVAALGVASVAAWIHMPAAMTAVSMSPDAIEHVGIANAWVHGAGWVNPVQWNYYLHTGVPYPAFAFRAPLISLLLALPLACGASLPTIVVVHALWASFIAGMLVLVGACFMRAPAAAAAAALITWSSAWGLPSIMLWTEATAVGAFGLVVATSGGTMRSSRGAVACGSATLIAWLARPNLGLLALVVVAAVVLRLGWRSALRHRPMWIYTFICFGGLVTAHVAVTASTGIAPYEAYGVVWRVMSVLHEPSRYQATYGSVGDFLGAHFPRIFALSVDHFRALAQALFEPRGAYFGIGWTVPAVVVYTIARHARLPLQHVVTVLAGVGLSLVVGLVWSSYDGIRFPLLPAVAFSLAACATFDDALARATSAARRGQPLYTALLVASFLPLALVTIRFLPRALVSPVSDFATYRANVAAPVPHPISDLCGQIEKDTIVASNAPWYVFYSCGNAALSIPSDITTPAAMTRFITAEGPAYFLVDGPTADRWLNGLPLLERVATSGSFALYAVRFAAPPRRPWIAPPPLECVGRATCVR